MSLRIRDAQAAALRRAQIARDLCAALEEKGYRASYDASRRLVSATDAANHTSRYQLSAEGKVDTYVTAAGRVSRFTINDAGLLTDLIEPSQRRTQLTLDDHVAPISFARDGTALVRFTWDDAREQCRADFSDGTSARAAYDLDGRPRRFINRLGQATLFSYDQAGRFSTMVDGLGQATSFTYDEQGRPQKTVHADGRVELARRDASGFGADVVLNGKPQLRRDADADNRPTHLQYADGAEYSYEYDALGRLTKAGGPNDDSQFEYIDDRLVRETSNGQAFAFEYDVLGLLKAVVYPDGTRADFTYDPDRRLATASWGGAQLAINYDTQDRSRTIATPRLTTELTLHPSGKPTRTTVRDAQSRAVRFDATYDYDAEDRLQSRFDSETGEERYVYDAESRLVGVTNARGQFRETFAYDAAANRRHTSGLDTEVASGNRLTAQGDWRCDYDDRGNLIKLSSSGWVWHFKFDLKNQLVEAHGPNGVLEFKYDALGRRIEKKSPDRTIRYVWCGELLTREIIETESGESVRDYLYHPGSYEPLALRIDGQFYYYHNDHQGTPQRLTDAQGNVVWAASYFAFGHAQVRIGLVENPLRFLGQYADIETGLHYNRFRYYSPALGRYISVDPVSLLGGPNLYVYAENDPINRSDPLGLFSWGAVAAAVGAGAAALAVAVLAPVAVPVMLAVVGGAAIGVALGIGIAEVSSINNFCWECFAKGAEKAFPTAFGVGFGIAAIGALCPPLGVALAVGAAVYGTYALLDHHFGWSSGKPFDQMTDREKSESVGELVGGTAGGILGGIAGGAFGGGIAEGLAEGPVEGPPVGEEGLGEEGVVEGEPVEEEGVSDEPEQVGEQPSEEEPGEQPTDEEGGEDPTEEEEQPTEEESKPKRSRPKPTRKATKTKRDVDSELDPDDPDVQDALDERNDAIEERDAARARGDKDAANQAQARANRATERLGELAADEAVADQYPDAITEHEGQGPGTLDRVYRNPNPPPEFVVAEAKGGSATNSSSRAGPNGQRFQQGTPEYLRSVLQQMASDQNATPESRALAEEMLNADPSNIDYVEVKQPIAPDGTLEPIKMNDFGPSRPGAAPANASPQTGATPPTTPDPVDPPDP